MGVLVDGVWQDKWYDTRSTGGRFVRPDSRFRNWVTADGSPGPTGEGGFKAEPGRYHLYVSLACPWANRTLIFRALKGLEGMIGVSVTHWLMAENGWSGAEVVVTVPVAQDARAAALSQLEADLAALDPAGFAEVWVDHDPFPSLCALINGPLGWLMVVRYSGDAGFSSRNPQYVGPVDSEIEYRLGNGQRDLYPAAWAYPRDVVCGALVQFARTRTLPADISWFNDSGDRCASPDEPPDAPG